MRYTVPNIERKLNQVNTGEIFGNLWATKNIDLDSNRGKLRLSERLYEIFNNSDDAQLELPVQFIRTDADQTDRWWALGQDSGLGVGANDGFLFKTTNTSPITGWTQDAIASSPSTAVDDMEIFGQASSYDRLVVSLPTDLTMLNNGAWTASWWVTTLSQSALTSGNPHQLHRFQDILLIADGNLVHQITSALVVTASKLTLPKDYQVIWFADDGYQLYIGTRHTRGGDAKVFIWDGISETYNYNPSVNSFVSYVGIVKDGVCWLVNGKGELMYYNGKSFETAAVFPVTESIRFWDNNTTRPQMIHPNGMKVINEKIHMLVSSQIEGIAYQDNFPSGLWVFDPQVGLYCKNTLGQYDGSTSYDWGGFDVNLVGALVKVDDDIGNYLIGAQVYTSATVTQRQIVVAKARNADSNLTDGYFITPQIASSDVRGFWRRLDIIFDRMDATTHKIIVKYKVKKDTFLDIDTDALVTATWATAGTQLQVVDADTTFDLTALKVGDEVEIINGRGAGLCAHLTVIATGATYTFTLDESDANFTGTCLVRFRRWVKMGTITNDTVRDFRSLRIGQRSPWIQFKIVLRGTMFSPQLQKLVTDMENSR